MSEDSISLNSIYQFKIKNMLKTLVDQESKCYTLVIKDFEDLEVFLLNLMHIIFINFEKAIRWLLMPN